MLILNEKNYVEELYFGRNNAVKSVVAKVGYITRYQLHALGYNDDDNYFYAVKWMTRHHDNFNENCYSKLISDAVKKAHKRPFFNVGDISITKLELEIISSLNNLRAEKILFVLLCMAKQQRIVNGFNNGLVKYSLPDLCKTARVSVPTSEREYILYQIIQRGYLDYPIKNDTSCLMVNFIDDEGEVELTVDEVDCKELAYTYLNWKNNGGYDRCERCGRLFRKNKNRKYCYDCAKYQATGDILVICNKCGKEFTVPAMAAKSIYCEDCRKEVHNECEKKSYEPVGNKTIECVDCGKEFEIDSSSRMIRCLDCYAKHQKERNRLKNQSFRARNIT